MSGRADRRHRTDRVVARRDRIARIRDIPPGGHRWHKTEHIGHCSNRGCWICACERAMKRDHVKQERAEARRDEREAA